MSDEVAANVDFTNTEIAFSDRSNKELRMTARLFQLMNSPFLVSLGSNLGLASVKLRLPFAESIIKKTIYTQFCGGVNLMDSQSVIDRLFRQDVLTILDYGAERKELEEEFDETLAETLKAIDFAASNESVPCVSSKITGLAGMDLLEKIQSKAVLTTGEQHNYDRLLQRLETLGAKASDLGVGVFIDAEESWIQGPIDQMVEDMMRTFNQTKVIIYNTYQMYRHDSLEALYKSFDKANSGGYKLGAKLVRGAYMEKERDRAEEMGYPSPIHADKESVDQDYDKGVTFCVENYQTVASCNASHNLESNLLQAELIDKMGIVKNHPHLNFCQLYGMSDNITFNLASKGYNVAKYLPYGPVKEVMPYLIRRARENTSITGDVSRELNLLSQEMKRRGM
jgi:proline dehydrogenase